MISGDISGTNGHRARAPKGGARVGRKTFRGGEILPKPRRYQRQTENGKPSRDPAAKVKLAAPNMGRPVLPHILTFQGIHTMASQAYRNLDEATKQSRQSALMMRKDTTIMECLEARQRGTALLNYHLEPEDPQSSDQKDLCDKLKKCLDRTPYFTEYRRSLQEALWFGRAGINNAYIKTNVNGRMQTVVGPNWRPINGDKLVFRYDDGSGKHDDGQIGIKVLNYKLGDVIGGNRIVEPTDWGMAYFLEPWERHMITVHRHFVEDAAFEDPVSAGSVHGVGIRSRIYWAWFFKNTAESIMMEFLQRSGQGIWVYYYPAHDDRARQEVQQIAEEKNESNVILLPRTIGDPGLDPFGIERVEPNPAGLESFRTIIHDYFGGNVKRYILGQTLTTEASATGLGSGVADLHLESFLQIIKYDATNAEESLTYWLNNSLKIWNHPDAADIWIKLKIDTEAADTEKKLNAAKSAWEMGAKIKAADIYDLIGFSEPTEDDEVLQNPQFAPQAMGNQAMGFDPSDPNGGPGGPGQSAPEGSVEDLFGPLAHLGDESESQSEPEEAEISSQYRRRRYKWAADPLSLHGDEQNHRVGESKTVGGHSYRLNENHRWERTDEQDSGQPGQQGQQPPAAQAGPSLEDRKKFAAANLGTSNHPIVTGILKSFHASPEFQSSGEYSTHQLAPEHAKQAYDWMKANVGKSFGDGKVVDLGKGRLGHASAAGAFVLQPPRSMQDGANWSASYTVMTGPVARAMGDQAQAPKPPDAGQQQPKKPEHPETQQQQAVAQPQKPASTPLPVGKPVATPPEPSQQAKDEARATAPRRSAPETMGPKRQAHEMTRGEFAQSQNAKQHKNHLKAAQAKGHVLSDEVIADYPELVPANERLKRKQAKAAPVAATTPAPGYQESGNSADPLHPSNLEAHATKAEQLGHADLARDLRAMSMVHEELAKGNAPKNSLARQTQEGIIAHYGKVLRAHPAWTEVTGDKGTYEPIYANAKRVPTPEEKYGPQKRQPSANREKAQQTNAGTFSDEEHAKYGEYEKMMTAAGLKPRAKEEWADHYRETQKPTPVAPLKVFKPGEKAKKSKKRRGDEDGGIGGTPAPKPKGPKPKPTPEELKTHVASHLKEAGLPVHDRLASVIEKGIASGVLDSHRAIRGVIRSAKARHEKGNLQADIDPHIKAAVRRRQAQLERTKADDSIKSAASEHGIPESDLREAVEHLHGERIANHDQREAAKAAARKRTGFTAAGLARLENQGKDYSSIPHFDEFAREIASEEPALGLGGDNPSEQLWAALREGAKRPPRKHELVDEAVRFLQSNPKLSEAEQEELMAIPFAKHRLGWLLRRYRKLTATDVDAAAADAKRDPSKEAREAGNYRKGHIRLHGLDISIENEKGSRRRPEWPPLSAHYGYFKRTEGKDGDHVDVFIGPNPESEVVFVIDQPTKRAGFDEHKCMIGWTNVDEAKTAYLANYTPDWKCGPITAMTIQQFKAWLDDGDTTKPVEMQVSRYAKGNPNHDELGRFAPKPGGTEAPRTITVADASHKQKPATHKDAAKLGKSLRGTYRNDNTGWDIHVYTDAINDTIYRHQQDWTAIHAIPELLQHAVRFADEPYEGNIDGVKTAHYFYAPLKMSDGVHLAKLTVLDRTDGIRQLQEFRLYNLSTRKSERLASTRADASSEEAAVSPANEPSQVSIGDLIEAVKEKDPGHVTDEFRKRYAKRGQGQRTLDFLHSGNQGGGQRHLNWTAEDEAKHPRDDHGQWVEKAHADGVVTAEEKAAIQESLPQPKVEIAGEQKPLFQTEAQGSLFGTVAAKKGKAGKAQGDLMAAEEEARADAAKPEPIKPSAPLQGQKALFADTGDSDKSTRTDLPESSPKTGVADALQQAHESLHAAGLATKPTKESRKLMEDFGEKIGGARKEYARPLGARTSTPKDKDERPAWARSYGVHQDAKTGKWFISKGESIVYSGGNPAEFDTKEAAESTIPLHVAADKHSVTNIAKKGEPANFAIYRKVAKGKYPVVKAGFGTYEEAMRHIASDPLSIIEHKFPRYETYQYLDRVQRDGPVHAKGDVTPKDFQEAFGFRGGEFGNWQSGRDGQVALNHAHDALHDLAEVLGVPPKAVSLNGDLAIAFGARGTGGKDAARAHYEPEKRVINLTKMKGAGTLAHEWAHALDAYIGQLGGATTHSHGISEPSYHNTKTQRPEVAEAAKNLINTITAKDEAVEHDIAHERKVHEKRREHVAERLRDLESRLIPSSYRKVKPFTPEQQKEWDELKEKLLNGDVGEAKYFYKNGGDTPANARGSMAGKWSFEPIERMNQLFKKATGRSFHTADDNSMGHSLYYSVKSAIDAEKRVKAAEDGAKTTRKGQTDFLREARKLDETVVADYYSKPHEMLARAFESYIEDKLAGKNRRSDYLIGKNKSHNASYRMFGMKPFPEGEERTAIHAAFDKLFSAIKHEEREDSKGKHVRLYRKRRHKSV